MYVVRGDSIMPRIHFPDDIHYNRVRNRYSDLCAYFKMLLTEQCITLDTYNLMKKPLDDMFEGYKDAYCDLEEIQFTENEEPENEK